MMEQHYATPITEGAHVSSGYRVFFLHVRNS
jgi:hypothetical protein